MKMVNYQININYTKHGFNVLFIVYQSLKHYLKENTK